MSGMLFFFFFKQKTAYEMRISDWSSDVCSSDLVRVQGLRAAPLFVDNQVRQRHRLAEFLGAAAARDRHQHGSQAADGAHRGPLRAVWRASGARLRRRAQADRPRSEEHTSELQSLMRSSYAVFCLKKKKQETISMTQILI